MVVVVVCLFVCLIVAVVVVVCLFVCLFVCFVVCLFLFACLFVCWLVVVDAVVVVDVVQFEKHSQQHCQRCSS